MVDEESKQTFVGGVGIKQSAALGPVVSNPAHSGEIHICLVSHCGEWGLHVLLGLSLTSQWVYV